MGLWDFVQSTILDFIPGGNTIQSGLQLLDPIQQALGLNNAPRTEPMGPTPTRDSAGTPRGGVNFLDLSGHPWRVVATTATPGFWKASKAGDNYHARHTMGEESIPLATLIAAYRQFDRPMMPGSKAEQFIAGFGPNRPVTGPSQAFDNATMSDITPVQVGRVLTDPTVENVTDLVTTALRAEGSATGDQPIFTRDIPTTADGLQLVKAPNVMQCLKADKGYVIVMYNGQKVQMLKIVAEKMGFWKPRRKPPISVSDWRCFVRAGAVEKKLVRIAKRAGMTKKTTRRSAPGPRPQLAAPASITVVDT